MKGSFWKKVLWGIAGLLAVTFVLYQLVMISSKKIRTEYVLHYDYYDTITTEGYFVRNEEVLTAQADGVLCYTVGDGEHVAASGTVAEVYSSEEDAAAQVRIAELEEQIGALKDLKTGTGQYAVNPELLSVQIDEKLHRLLSITEKGRMDGLKETSADFLTLLNKRQIATGMIADFGGTILQLEGELANLQSSVGQAASRVKVSSSGYFVSTVDGLEQALTPAELEGLTPEKLEEIKKTTPAATDNAVGKLVYDYEWYIACILTEEQASVLTKGKSVDVMMQTSTGRAYSVTVDSIHRGTGDGRCVVILRCATTSSELFSARRESLQIRLQEYSGLRVASSAVRVVDGVRGVYVLSGITAKFKPINAVYSNSNFTICQTDATASNGLKLYDEVIVAGRDLYDGKVVK